MLNLGAKLPNSEQILKLKWGFKAKGTTEKLNGCEVVFEMHLKSRGCISIPHKNKCNELYDKSLKG
jgi:hypothetical protein